MKITLSKREYNAIRNIIIDLSDDELTQTPGIMEIYNNGKEYIVDVNPKYITETLKEYHKWLPLIVSTVRSAVLTLQEAMDNMSKKEREVIKKLRTDNLYENI